MKKKNDELKTTSNRSVYNKLRKRYLESTGKIRCSWCGYHKGENKITEFYGEVLYYQKNKKSRFKHPSWKLTSKARKQWQDKRVKKVFDNTWRGDKYVVFKFKRNMRE
jgi:hypothetical protein